MASRDTCLDRRNFLGLAAGGAALWISGCGDDGSAGEGEDESGGGTAADGTVGDDDDDDDDDNGSTGPGEETGIGDDDDDDYDDDDSEDESTGGEPVECETDTFEEEFDAGAIPQDDDMFPLAVMAGEMRRTSAMFSTLLPGGGTKTLRVWRPGDRDGVMVIVAELEVEPDADGYSKTTIEGLCPGTWYRYAFFQGSRGNFTARSLIGEVQTAPENDSVEPLTVAISACNGNSFDWPALEVTADEYYDMFLHLGDMAYNDGSFTLEEYRASWRQYLSTLGMRVAYSRAGLFATWDDHEIDDNSNFDRETMRPDQLEKRQNAMDAYFEIIPIDAEGPDYQLWRSFRWGSTAEIIVLDCRYERRPSMGQYISPEQMEWLKDRLANSPCHFKIIMNSVPITNMPLVWDVAANDRWEGFPNDRDDLLSFIDDNAIDNVWFVSGDFHVCFISRLEMMGDSRSANLHEIAITGGRTNPLGDLLPGNQFSWGSSQPHGCLLTFDPAENSVTVRFIDPGSGVVAHEETLSYD